LAGLKKGGLALRLTPLEISGWTDKTRTRGLRRDNPDL